MEQKSITLTTQNPAQLPIEQLEKMAQAFVKSGLFGVQTVDQAVALMLIAQAEGLHPAIAARDFHIIKGRHSLKADAMLSRFHANQGKVQWNEYSDTVVSGTFSHPSGGTATITWTIDQAKAAGLAGKDNWKSYPRAMLRSRVISEGVRTVFPGVAVGVYTPEEVEDFAQPQKPAPIEVKAEEVKPIPDVAEPGPNDALERKALMKLLSQSGWAPNDLSDYSMAAFGKNSARNLCREELETLVSVASKSNFGTAMRELNPNFEADVP